MATKRRYPIGIQTFWEIATQNYVYADKTAYIHKMASVGKYYFLNRPRRFGKSLLISTMKAYFEGRRELFDGLALGKLETRWVTYPVIRLDFSVGKYYTLERTHTILNGLLKDYEQELGINAEDPHGYGERMKNIIRAAHRQTGLQVVVLIDEYDAPMLDTIDKPLIQEQIRNCMRDFFSPLKSQADNLRFVFLTGISKFSQLSVFSELNNLKNISFDPTFEGICGITEEELLTTMSPDIQWLAQQSGQTYEHIVQELKRMYDGYHFSSRMTDIYNPWSLLNAFDMGDIQNFWFATGTPTSLIQLLQKHHLDLPDLEGIQASLERFDAPTDRITDPIPVLFQSGYLTLKGYEPATGTFTLDFPNEEVYRGFANSLYKYYCEDYPDNSNQVNVAFRALQQGECEIGEFLEVIRRFYSAIPYSITNKNERHYQSILYTLLAAIGADVSAEVETATGRMDMILRGKNAIYIFEFKYDGDANTALRQILEKNYPVRFASDPRPKIAVGINFSSASRTIEDYLVAHC